MNLYHVYSDFMGSGDTYKRHHFAKRTWNEIYKEGPWVPVPIKDAELKRSSRNVGDSKTVPFIKDLLTMACSRSGPDDILVLTNADTCFARGITEALIEEVSVNISMSAHRYDFHHDLYEIYTPSQVMMGDFYVGADLFAFKKSWWIRNSPEYPDMLLGYEAWDWIMREMVHKHGGKIWYQGMIYHRSHPAYWHQSNVKRTHPSQVHNVRLAREWLTRNKIPLRELA